MAFINGEIQAFHPEDPEHRKALLINKTNTRQRRQELYSLGAALEGLYWSLRIDMGSQLLETPERKHLAFLSYIQHWIIKRNSLYDERAQCNALERHIHEGSNQIREHLLMEGIPGFDSSLVS